MGKSVIYHKIRDWLIKFMPVWLSIVLTGIGWLQLETSFGIGTVRLIDMELQYIILNLITVFMIYLVIFLITNRILLTSVIFEIMMFALAVINYYVILFHGSPLSAFELKNFTTAVNVIGGYEFPIATTPMLHMTLGLIVAFALISFVKFYKNDKLEIAKKVRLKAWVRVLTAVVTVGVFFLLYLSPVAIKPIKAIGWSWTEAYYKYGYAPCAIETIYTLADYITKPEGYSEDALDAINIEAANQNNEKPDIILILNETFYDLNLIADIETDRNYFEHIYGMENVIRGNAIVTNIGGGTNCSEYELLTSNSLNLMPGITPFNVLNMNNANSIVSYLKELGYSATAAHAASSENYMRRTAYPDMGFENVYFQPDFENLEYYENRSHSTDESNYENLINWYHALEEEQPRFMYLLTIQNHGAWDRDQEDLVHVTGDWGEYEDDINEYLSCMYLSDLAFKELTDYYETVDRPVIICMVGDHSPTFASEIVDEKYTEEEKNLLLRSTPFVIWSNYGLEGRDEGTISLNYLVPTMLEAAGVKLSPYYQYMLDLKEEIPVLTSYGKYIDKEGTIHQYEEDGENTDMVNQYFYMEYNNLQKSRRQELFEPYTVN